MNPNNVLVIPDTHFPFEKKGILEHCLRMQRKYDCGTVVHIGDEVDLCGVSQWEKDQWDPKVENILEQALTKEPDEDVRKSIQRVLEGKSIE